MVTLMLALRRWEQDKLTMHLAGKRQVPMTKARMLVIVVATLSIASQLAFCAPVIKGIALCKQTLPGEKETDTCLANLALVTLPDGKPVRLFPKIPAGIPPAAGDISAWLIDAGRLVLVHLHYASGSKDSYLLLVNPATGKLSIIADDVARDSFIEVSPDRKTILYCNGKMNRLNVWRTDGHKMLVTAPKGWNFSRVDWTERMPHPCMTLVRVNSEKQGKFWLDEHRHTLQAVVPDDPWAKALDVCMGKYLFADSKWDLWLIGPGRKKIKLARLEVEGEPPESIWYRFSPDGKYAVCSCDRSAGEPRFTSASYTYYFDLRGKKPVQLIRPKDSGGWDELGNFVDWYSTENGILRAFIQKILWTDLPSLKTQEVTTLPDKCEFIDFVRRDEPSPRGKQK